MYHSSHIFGWCKIFYNVLSVIIIITTRSIVTESYNSFIWNSIPREFVKFYPTLCEFREIPREFPKFKLAELSHQHSSRQWQLDFRLFIAKSYFREHNWKRKDRIWRKDLLIKTNKILQEASYFEQFTYLSLYITRTLCNFVLLKLLISKYI